MIPRFQAYIFDVDGTLLDSAPDICGAIREVLHGTRHQHCDERLLRSYIALRGTMVLRRVRIMIGGCCASPEMIPSKYFPVENA